MLNASLFTRGIAIVFALASASAGAQTVRVQPVAQALDHPWAVAFLPQGRFLVTERAGRLRRVDAQGNVSAPLQGLPAIASGGQGGLLDIVTDNDFARNRMLYFCFSEPDTEPRSPANSTALARARLSEDETRLEGVQVLFSQKPKVASNLHFGCRIVEGRDGTLFLALGDRYHHRDAAQKLDNHIGKVVRVHKDGSVPPDNPFVGRAGALPEIWSYGHRNAQGATLAPDGRYWMHEHGPQGGDEINIPQAGRNYGWPVITFGENYGGGKIGEGTARAGMEPPLHYWVPSIAPSGMVFLTSDRYGPTWKGNLFVGSLKFGFLNRIELNGQAVRAEHRLLEDGRERIRDVRQGPDGLLYVLTDAASGRLLRLQPVAQ